MVIIPAHNADISIASNGRIPVKLMCGERNNRNQNKGVSKIVKRLNISINFYIPLSPHIVNLKNGGLKP
jgi:hypothetical protein